MLYVVAMLALLAAAVQSLLLSSAALEKRVWTRDRLDNAFEATVARTVLGVSDPRPEKRWAVNGSSEDFEFDGVKIVVRVQDQLGLIDLNAADGSMLKRLLQVGGVNDDVAETLVKRILKWRSPPQDNQAGSDADYDAVPYRPRHGAFQSVSELRLVLGMTPELFTRLAPALTVHSGHPAFETSTAPELALRALYLERPEEVSRILAERHQSAGPARAGTLPTGTSLGGRSLKVEADLERDGKSYRRSAVVMLTEDPARPYLVLAWN